MHIDWWYIWKLSGDQRRNEDLKITLKDELFYIPVLGVGIWLFDFLFLTRKWEKDEAIMTKKFRQWTEQQLRLLFLIFPEGTTVNTKALETSKKYATAQNRPQLDLLLLPRVTGFNKALTSLENVTTIYDLTIAYPTYSGEIPSYEDGYTRHIDTGIPSFKSNCAAEQPSDKVHIHINKIDVTKAREADVTEFLDTIWVKKEQRLRQFINKKTLLLDDE